jgi:hypothetical protein
MGKFEIISMEGVKSYTVFNKNSFNKILMLSKNMPMYSFYGEGRDDSKEIYLDSPNNLLANAGIILCKVIDNGKAFFRVDREELKPNMKILSREKRVFIHPIGSRDSVLDHALFLTDGISSMFSTKFYIDLENVLKTVVPKIEIENQKTVFRILSGKGFKANMSFEKIKIRNYDSKRKADLFMLNIEQTSSRLTMDEFNDFTSKLEKYCKEIMPTSDSKYKIAKRMTNITTNGTNVKK